MLKDLKMSLVKCPAGVNASGCFVFFEKEYSDTYKKYLAIEKEYEALWGEMDEVSMDRFKKVLEEWLVCTKWIYSKYFERQCAAEAQRR